MDIYASITKLINFMDIYALITKLICDLYPNKLSMICIISMSDLATAREGARLLLVSN
jgi:hypothetical protein